MLNVAQNLEIRRWHDFYAIHKVLCIASEGDISQIPVFLMERRDTVLLCLWLNW